MKNVPEETLSMDLLDKDLKLTITNIFKELKQVLKIKEKYGNVSLNREYE